MGYLEGFGVTIRQHRLFGGKRVTTKYSGGRSRGAGRKQGRRPTPAPDVRRRRQGAKPERLHGRHVLNRYEDGMEKCIGCELCAGVCPAEVHLRARRRQRSRRPDVAGRALRLRLRDQLPPLHPLRPVRRGVPDRGDHRVEAVRVLVHQPPGRDLHQGRAGRRRRRQAAAHAVGGLARGRGRADAAAGCAATSPSGDATFERRRSAGAASSATACAPPEPEQAVRDALAGRRERARGGRAVSDADIPQYVVFFSAAVMILGGAIGVIV